MQTMERMNQVIQLEQVEKEIRGEQVLRGINLTFTAGKQYGIYGSNGSGKTMLLRMIAGLIRPSAGQVRINGRILHQDMDFPPGMGILIETPEFWKHYTGMEVLETLGKIRRTASKEEMRQALLRVGLDPKDRRTVRKYSLGMRQRLGIAQAIMEKPEILLLDEPTNALDEAGAAQVRRIFREEAQRGAVVILASHVAEDLADCDVCIGMKHGRILGGSPVF